MPKGLKRAASILVVALALYSLLGFLILPGVALRVINAQLAQHATVPAHLARLELNPFSLEVSTWGLRIGEPGQEHVAFERLYANLQLDSIWSGALHLRDVELEKARTEVLFAKNGTLNLTQLFKLPPSESKTEDKPSSGIFPVRIERIALIENGLHFQDLRPSEAVDFVYDSLNLELKNLSTLPDDNADMTLVATGPAGGRIDWSGQVSLSPIASSGQLKLTELNMKGFWPYVRDAVPLVLEQGTLSLDTHYSLNLANGTELQLRDISATLAPFTIKSPADKPLVKLERLDVGKTHFDLAKQQVTVGEIRSTSLETWAAREADGQLDWQKLFASQPAKVEAKPVASGEEAKPAAQQEAAQAQQQAAPDDPSAAAVNAQPPAAARPWQVVLKDVQLRDYQIHLADRAPGQRGQEVKLDLAPLNLDLKDFDSLGTSPFALALDTGVNGKGRIKADGQVQLSPVSAKLQVATRNIDLRLAQAYLSPFVRLEVRSGLLDSDLAVDLQGTEPLAFSITGKATVNQLHTLDTIKERDFVRWQRLQVDDLSYRHSQGLSIGLVTLDKPYARVIINEDLTTNVNELIVKQASSSEKPKVVSAPAEKPMPIRIGGVNINDGSANFADFSLTPNFATALQQLNGKIGTLDNQSPKTAAVNIEGKVDRYAPVSIKGALTPFDPLNSLDIATSFKNVELTTLTPYSGKFAGYRIRKGRLNLDLHYRIEQGELNAENKLLLENLQLGEKVDSKDAVDLPIRLAVALLKDTQGKISLELPVKGNLNNPQFSVMPIVWQTLRNLVLRAAQAPFKFVAGLVGGSDSDLSQVPFTAGSSELSGQAQKNLDTLVTALQQRPMLRLEVEGIASAQADGPLLAEQRLEREYQATWYKVLQRRGDTVPAEAEQLQVSDSDKKALLEGIYRSRLKQQPPTEWTKLDDDERTAQLRNAVLQSWSGSELLLRQLSQARAASIKAYLVDTGKLEDQRVYMLDVSNGEAEQDGSVNTALHLGSGE